MVDEIKKQKKLHSGLKNTEYLSLAAAQWAEYKKTSMKQQDEPNAKTKSIDTTTNNSTELNEITYADIDDPMGLYIDLTKYIKDQAIPFDMDKLFPNATKLQEEMEFGNKTKVTYSFTNTSAVRVVMNEFKCTYLSGVRNNFTVSPIKDNIYHLSLVFSKDFFDKSCKIYADIDKLGKNIEIEIRLEGKLYPFYPPKVKIISPRMLNHVNCKIATMECLLLSNWRPIFNIETVINHFKNIMDQFGEIDIPKVIIMMILKMN